MSATYPPFAVGNHPSNIIHLADLGNVYQISRERYVVCRASVALTSPGGSYVASALSGGAKTYVVTTTVIPDRDTFVGIVPAGHANVAANEFFLVKVVDFPRILTDDPVTLTDQATIAIDCSLGDVFDVTLALSRIVGAPTNPTDGAMIRLRIEQGGAGSCLVTWNAVFDWGTAGAPTLSTAVGKRDIVEAMYSLAKTKWEAVLISAGHG